MKQLKIKDNSARKKVDFHAISELVESIANKSLYRLEQEGVFVFPEVVKDSEDITKEQMILQSINDDYRTENVMGFIGMGDERLVIESRLSNNENDYFFQYLLEKVLEVPNIVNLETDAAQDNKLYNLLLFLFPQYLKAAMRKGLFKTYIRRSYNDENVKGVIDVARHIRANVPFVGNIAYHQREYDYDNYLMELVRHTIEYIKGKSYGNKLLTSVKDEVKLINSVTLGFKTSDRRKIMIENQKNIVTHAFYHEYKALQQLCILILRNEKHQIGLGTRRIYGILFDGAWLWEEYINTLIESAYYHPMNKGGQGVQWLFAGGKGKIYPDFISRDKKQRIIADAKYKPIQNIGNKDYLQVLAYMFRFDAKKGFYLYPECENTDGLELWLNRGVSYEKDVESRRDISVTKLGLRIPRGCNSYMEFVNEMKVNEETFVSEILVNYQGIMIGYANSTDEV